MLTALAELPFELAVHAFQAAFEMEALQDINEVDTDARLYDAATKAASSEASFDMLCGALVRSGHMFTQFSAQNKSQCGLNAEMSAQLIALDDATNVDHNLSLQGTSDKLRSHRC